MYFGCTTSSDQEDIKLTPDQCCKGNHHKQPDEVGSHVGSGKAASARDHDRSCADEHAEQSRITGQPQPQNIHSLRNQRISDSRVELLHDSFGVRLDKQGRALNNTSCHSTGRKEWAGMSMALETTKPHNTYYIKTGYSCEYLLYNSAELQSLFKSLDASTSAVAARFGSQEDPTGSTTPDATGSMVTTSAVFTSLFPLIRENSKGLDSMNVNFSGNKACIVSRSCISLPEQLLGLGRSVFSRTTSRTTTSEAGQRQFVGFLENLRNNPMVSVHPGYAKFLYELLGFGETVIRPLARAIFTMDTAPFWKLQNAKAALQALLKVCWYRCLLMPNFSQVLHFCLEAHSSGPRLCSMLDSYYMYVKEYYAWAPIRDHVFYAVVAMSDAVFSAKHTETCDLVLKFIKFLQKFVKKLCAEVGVSRVLSIEKLPACTLAASMKAFKPYSNHAVAQSMQPVVNSGETDTLVNATSFSLHPFIDCTSAFRMQTQQQASAALDHRLSETHHQQETPLESNQQPQASLLLVHQAADIHSCYDERMLKESNLPDNCLCQSLTDAQHECTYTSLPATITEPAGNNQADHFQKGKKGMGLEASQASVALTDSSPKCMLPNRHINACMVEDTTAAFLQPDEAYNSDSNTQTEPRPEIPYNECMWSFERSDSALDAAGPESTLPVPVVWDCQEEQLPIAFSEAIMADSVTRLDSSQAHTLADMQSVAAASRGGIPVASSPSAVINMATIVAPAAAKSKRVAFELGSHHEDLQHNATGMAQWKCTNNKAATTSTCPSMEHAAIKHLPVPADMHAVPPKKLALGCYHDQFESEHDCDLQQIKDCKVSASLGSTPRKGFIIDIPVDAGSRVTICRNSAAEPMDGVQYDTLLPECKYQAQL